MLSLELTLPIEVVMLITRGYRVKDWRYDYTHRIEVDLEEKIKPRNFGAVMRKVEQRGLMVCQWSWQSEATCSRMSVCFA